ncbi:MAG TPA: hypothetical protein VI316_04040 [Candidatus Dormibacteraeota bacterium]
MVSARHAWVVVRIVVLVALLAALWAFPPLFFAHPGTNDAIVLSNWELPIILAVLVAGVTSAFVRPERRPRAVPIGLGVYFLGTAAGLRLGLAVFGDGSNDRFAPLLFGSVLMGCAGLAALAGVLATGGASALQVRRGTVNGLVGAMFVGGWVLLRGGRDWLLAPYGFDSVLLMALLAVVVATLGAAPGAWSGPLNSTDAAAAGPDRPALRRGEWTCWPRRAEALSTSGRGRRATDGLRGSGQAATYRAPVRAHSRRP